ncbi:unnamed protein product [Enterobius vermicularis]|uniref:E3 ubiquitin-protein ligase PPP1R11 n=1 Tax=Enterobius vermicularis TaxID=51028 RepID=A0A0N4UVE3_ENTVE|nr:unnamed protein product [Enterobius vermicularis]
MVLSSRDESSEPRVRWTADTVDNEMMGKKKSKCCCIYKKPRKWDEDSDSSDSGKCQFTLQKIDICGLIINASSLGLRDRSLSWTCREEEATRWECGSTRAEPHDLINGRCYDGPRWQSWLLACERLYPMLVFFPVGSSCLSYHAVILTEHHIVCDYGTLVQLYQQVSQGCYAFSMLFPLVNFEGLHDLYTAVRVEDGFSYETAEKF